MPSFRRHELLKWLCLCMYPPGFFFLFWPVPKWVLGPSWGSPGLSLAAAHSVWSWDVTAWSVPFGVEEGAKGEGSHMNPLSRSDMGRRRVCTYILLLGCVSMLCFCLYLLEPRSVETDCDELLTAWAPSNSWRDKMYGIYLKNKC